MEEKNFFMCPACKEKSFLKIKKDFDGFKVTGKKKTCGLCGYEFKQDEEIAYLKDKSIFDEEEGEKHFCKDCANYVVHPWTQKCTLTNEEVTALDSCRSFTQKEREID